MKTTKHVLPAILSSALFAMAASAGIVGEIYLNNQNMTVSLGPSMSPNPFGDRPTAASLASIIDAPSASASERHGGSTHVWVNGGTLELVFDLQSEYNLTKLHFWNYHSESNDVDNIDFRFYDALNSPVGSLLGVAPLLGGSAPSDSTPIFAQDYSLSFPSKVRYVNAVLSGSNGQVDFNNLGFTGAVVPEPATATLLLFGLSVVGTMRRRTPKRA